LKTKQVDHSGV